MISRGAFIAGVLVLAISGGVYALKLAGSVVGADVSLALFDTGAITQGILYLPITKNRDGSVAVSVRMDADGNGTITDSEHVADSISIPLKAGERIGIPVQLPAAPPLGTRVELYISGRKFERRLGNIERMPDLLEFSKVKNANLSMKWGINIAYAKGADVTRASPDIPQGVAECAPAAAANAIIALLNQYGLESTSTPESIMSELKPLMKWTREEGVYPDNFVAGLDTWIQSHNLPITTERVGDNRGQGTLQNILIAMREENPAVAEVHLHVVNQDGKNVGGHMVTVVGLRDVEGDYFIDVHDPRTPDGTETYKLNGAILQGYPVDGLALLAEGFVQSVK